MPKPKLLFRKRVNAAVNVRAAAKSELTAIQARRGIAMAKAREVERKIAFGLPVGKNERSSAGSEVFGELLEERLHMPKIRSASTELAQEKNIRSRGLKGLVRQSVAFGKTLRSSRDTKALQRNQDRVLEASKKGLLSKK